MTRTETTRSRELSLSRPQERVVSKAAAKRFTTQELPGREKQWLWNWVGVLASHEAFMYVLIDDELCWMSFSARDLKRFESPDEFNGAHASVDLYIGGGMSIGPDDEYVPFTAAWRPDSGETDASVELELHLTGEPRVYRAVAPDQQPVPDIKIGWKPLDEFGDAEQEKPNGE